MNEHENRLRRRIEDAKPVATQDELRELAEEIVRYCPSLTHLLLALGSPKDNPLKDLN